MHSIRICVFVTFTKMVEFHWSVLWSHIFAKKKFQKKVGVHRLKSHSTLHVYAKNEPSCSNRTRIRGIFLQHYEVYPTQLLFTRCWSDYTDFRRDDHMEEGNSMSAVCVRNSIGIWSLCCLISYLFKMEPTAPYGTSVREEQACVVRYYFLRQKPPSVI